MARMSRGLPQVPVRSQLTGPMGYLYASVVALLGLGAAFAAARYLLLANLSLILLLCVVIVAARTRMSIAVYTATVCFLGYNFFFTRPYYTLVITHVDDLVTVVMFLVVALICSRLATQLASQVESLRLAQQRASALLTLDQRLAGCADAAMVYEAGALALADTIGASVVLLKRDAQRALQVALSVPPGQTLSANEIAAASWNSGPGAQDLLAVADPAAYWVVPLTVGMHDYGAIALLLKGARIGDAQDRRNLALAMSQDIAQALERVRLSEALESTRMQAESERLRNALLASVSHDLRSPLAAIIGSAGTLGEYGQQLGEDDRRQLIDGIVQEGERLDRYIQNLLDMTRLGHGSLTLQRDWVDASELILAAVARLRRLFPDQSITTQMPPDTVLLHVHPALIEQALFNILENAAHFSPPAGTVQLQLTADESQVQIDVGDQGPGIPLAERSQIFDMFYSVSRGDRGNHGTGLGLAICRGMLGAHGGQVQALEAPGGGTLIRVTLPRSPIPVEAAP